MDAFETDEFENLKISKNGHQKKNKFNDRDRCENKLNKQKKYAIKHQFEEEDDDWRAEIREYVTH